MNVGFRSVVMAVIIMLALASASFAAATPLGVDGKLGPATGDGHTASICPATTVDLVVDAGTTTGPHYAWSEDTLGAVGTDSATYQAAAGGVYKCTVTGDCAGQAVSEVCTVTMLVPPVIL